MLFLLKTFLVAAFLNDLNEIQRQAVEAYKGPSLIIAGAGSGKTRVLTYRIAFLLSNGIPAHSILALTFTNKAAKEMKERIAHLVGSDLARQLWMGTFHSIFSRILRSEAEKINFNNKFTIYDSSDSKSLIGTIIKERKLDVTVYKPSDVASRISWAKNNLITPNAYQSNSQLITIDRTARKAEIVNVYTDYMARCKRANALDFDDLLLYTNILFRDAPDTLAKYQNGFKYILVDEYQDTNYAQYLIIKKLSGIHKNISVVGDDAQSIYSFRGAKIENILNFRNDYPDFQLFKLEQNYRSTQSIVKAANSIIQKNKGQIQKNVWSSNEMGNKIKVVEAATDKEEAYIVANEIAETQIADKALYSDFAILYRTNAQSRNFEESLRKRSIPYKIYGGLSFFNRKEIKDLIAYFRLSVNPDDDEAFKRIINYPARGIGDTTLDRISTYAYANSLSLWKTISMIQTIDVGLQKAGVAKIMTFANLIKVFQDAAIMSDAYEYAMQVFNQSGILQDLQVDKTYENISRIENIEALMNSIKEFIDQNKQGDEIITIDNFLETVSLLTDADSEKDEDKNKVSLMTIHASKGLEYNYVYIVGLEEELFPSAMSLSTVQDIEEERRLFYVALTRARKQAMFSYANFRYKWGQPTFCHPSRFIDEVDKDFLILPERAQIESNAPFEFSDNNTIPKTKTSHVSSKIPLVPAPTVKKTYVDANFVPDAPETIKTGMTVLHPNFGSGTVMEIQGDMPNAKATVEFIDAGSKTLLLKFAKLKILNN